MSEKKPHITQAELKELFDYCEETGNLIYKTRVKYNNKRGIGDKIGSKGTNGYIICGINRKYYNVHRLIYLYHHNLLPITIDHINNDKSDNRIENLRAATFSQNQHNKRKSCNNKSGYKGVSSTSSNKFMARITIDGNCINLGTYDTPELAAKAYADAAKEHHKEFHNLG